MHFGLLRDSCTAGVAGAAMKTLRRVLSMAAHAVAFERAIVTGAGSGIGRATAAALCERGLDVYGVGRREGALLETAKRIGDNFHPIVADVATPEGRGAIADCIDGAASTVLVHNAATTGPLGPLDALTLDGFRATMASNVEGPLFLTKALMPKLAQGSRVLHVSTGGAHQGFDGMLSYCASKAALRSVYESLRDEYAGRIIFGSAQPGVVATEMMRGLVRRRCGTCFHAYSGRTRHSLVDPGTGRGHGRLLRDPVVFHGAGRRDAGGGRHDRGTRRRAQLAGERRALLRVPPV